MKLNMSLLHAQGEVRGSVRGRYESDPNWCYVKQRSTKASQNLHEQGLQVSQKAEMKMEQQMR